MGLIESISRLSDLRNCGEVICAVEDKTVTIDPLDVQVLLRIGSEHGLRIESEFLRTVERALAIQIIARVLAADLAYESELMSPIEAASLGTEFVGVFSDPALFLTNATFSPSPKYGLSLTSWNPFAERTFDTGVICVSKSKIGLLWASDDD